MPQSVYTHVTANRTSILDRGYDETGTRYQRIIPYEPSLWLPDPRGTFRAIDGTPLSRYSFGTVGDAKDYVKKYENHQDIYGITNFALAYIQETYHDLQEPNQDLFRVGIIDIEVDSSAGFPSPETTPASVTLISLKFRGLTTCFGLEPYNSTRDDVQYVKCSSETNLLRKFLHLWQALDLDIITGWNCQGYDLPYLYNRMCKLLGKKAADSLSPWKYCYTVKKIGKYNREYTAVSIPGINILDYMLAYQKFRLKERENYRLDTIARIELEESKQDYSSYGSLESLRQNNYIAYVDYNIHDVYLVEKLESKLGYIKLILSLTYLCKINMEDAFRQTTIWDALTNNFLMKQNIVVPPRKTHSDTSAYTGAFVKTPRPGFHDYIVSYDARSLYPSTILQYNISPDTFLDSHDPIRLEDIISPNWTHEGASYCIAGNGSTFDCSVTGFLPKILVELMERRNAAKTEMLQLETYKNTLKETDPERKVLDDQISTLDTLQKSLKVVNNSCYGTLGTPYFRFYDTRLTEAITLTGQLAIQTVIHKFNLWMNEHLGTTNIDYVIASDTDSIYVTLEPFVRHLSPEERLDHVDRISKETIEPVLTTILKEFSRKTNAPHTFLEMKREIIATKGIWTAKKRYALDVYYDETGKLPKPKIKVTGLESVRSSIPEWARKKYETIVKLMLRTTEKEVQAEIKKIHHEFQSLPPEDIAINSSISDLDKYAKSEKSIPIHVFGAIQYNKLSRNTTIQPITNGDKIKYVLLIKPNPINSHVISFQHRLPEEFGLSAYIDKEAQFDRIFMKPVRDLLDIVGWSVKPQKRFGIIHASK